MPECIIKILDEVNVKLEGLDVGTRRKCSNVLSYILPQAYHMPAFKLGRWNGKVNFFTMGGGTQINLLDRILPIVQDDGYDIIIEDNRASYDFKFPHIDKDYLKDTLWPDSHPTHPGQSIELRDHQVLMVNNFLDNLQSIQTCPTSGGKTITTGSLSKLIEPYGRSIVIVPNVQLVEQTLEDYLLMGLDAGVYYGDEKNWGKKHTICTWQSLDRLLKKTKDGEAEQDKTIQDFIKDVTAIIIDEVHNAKAEVLRKLLTGIFRNVPIRWGLTGTVPKQEFDIASLIGSIGNIIHGVSAAELQEQGILSHCKIEIIQTQSDLKFNDYASETKWLTTNQARLDWIAEFVTVAGDSGNTLVLVNRVATGKELIKLIPNSVFIDGGVKVKNRKAEYDLIATEDNKVIIATYGVAAVGINVPRVFNVVLVEPGKSFIRTIQSIGRGLRRASDKDNVMIYDLCSSTKYSKRHLTERKKFYKESEYPFVISKVIM